MGWIVIAVVVGLVVLVGYSIWRLKHVDELDAGGSMGQQTFGKDHDDWGPKPSE